MEQMMMSTCINIIVAAASFLILWQIYRSRRNRTWAAPHGCTNWPVVGMLPSLICHASDFHDRLTAILRRHGGTVELKGPWFSGMDSIVTSDPANVRHIQSGNFGNYPKGPVMKEVFEPFGDGIFTVDFESWVLQRKKLHLLIKNNRYKLLMEKATHAKLEYGMFQILDHLAENGDESDLQDIFQRFTLDAICIIVMGFDPRSLNIDFHDAPLAKAFDDIGKGIFRRHVIPKIAWKLQKWLRMGTEKQLSIAMQRFDDFLYSFISSRRKQIIAKRMDDEVEETVDDDLLTAHVKGEIMDKNDGVLVLTEDKFLRDMVLNLLGAGRSTIASTLVWLFWSLTNNPHVESKILAELNSSPPTLEKIHFHGMTTLLGHDPLRVNRQHRLYNEEEVNCLTYLHAAIMETLRLYPPLPINHKWAMEADLLPSGHHVRPKTRVFFSAYAMARMEDVWGPDCNEFKPERWITEKGEIQLVPSHRFATFNGGPRSCLGKEVSLIQLKIVAAAILWRYKIWVVDGHPVSVAMSTMLNMKHGLRVWISHRST